MHVSDKQSSFEIPVKEFFLGNVVRLEARNFSEMSSFIDSL